MSHRAFEPPGRDARGFQSGPLGDWTLPRVRSSIDHSIRQAGTPVATCSVSQRGFDSRREEGDPSVTSRSAWAMACA
jgi:hypothetical protein